MGNQQPKKLKPITKIQVEVASTKSKFHLQLMRDRKNAEIIRAERQLVTKLKSPSRNKIEEILLAQRIISALKYAQACNLLMSYCATLKSQANFLAQNMYNPQKLQPFLMMIYSLIYAAETMGLSSLKQFRDLMRALNDPTGIPTFTNPEIITLLTPQPTSQQLNLYFIQMSQRNNLPLQQINIIGHKFSNNVDEKPSNDPSFSDIQRQLADQLKKNMENQGGKNNQGGQGQGGQSGQSGQGGQGGHGGQGGQGGQWSQGGFGGFGGNNGNQGWNNNQNYGPGQQQYGSNQSFNPLNYGNNQLGPNNNLGPTNNQRPIQGTTIHDTNPYGIRQTYRPNNQFGPQYYDPPKVQQQKDLPKPNILSTQSKFSIKDINDIAYFPQIEPIQPAYKFDMNFDALCQKIKTGL